MPDPVVVSAAAKHTATLVFLHGLGDTGSNLFYPSFKKQIRSPPSWQRITSSIARISVPEYFCELHLLFKNLDTGTFLRDPFLTFDHYHNV